LHPVPGQEEERQQGELWRERYISEARCEMSGLWDAMGQS
jgi:hypothetical protein